MRLSSNEVLKIKNNLSVVIMKKVLILIVGCLCAQMANAQVTPKWAEKAKKAVFSIVTYDKENKIKGTGNGFYIDSKGTALSDYSLFEGAERAIIINADGKQMEVTEILGANSMYDIIKFATTIDKKHTNLTGSLQPAKVGDTIYLLPYSTQKAATCQTGKVTAIDSIGNNSFYYTLEMKTGEKAISCPIVNANGELLGMIQKNASDDSMESYAIGANYGVALNISALSSNDAALNKVGIKKALPDTEEQALIMLYMASELNNEKYLELLNDFIRKFPDSSEGYIRRAGFFMNHSDEANYAQANEDIEQAIKVATNKEEAKYQVAKTIYNYLISLGDKQPYENWSYDNALNILREAIADNSQPIYVQLEGDILFAQGNYMEAFNSYATFNQSELASPASFYAAAKAKQLTEGSDINEVIALMDSAIVHLKKPYFAEAAPYFYERAELHMQASKFREAVMDYNTFHNAVSGDVNALFYFQREQAEMQCRMYQQALNDINKAVEMDPEDVDFWAEKGAVHLRVNQLDEAISALKKAISLNDQHAASYRLLGYCQAMKNMNKEACQNFAKAKELGDEIVDKLMEKYCK